MSGGRSSAGWRSPLRWGLRAAKVVADDGGGDGGVERFGTAETRNGHVAGHARGDGGRQAAAFTADHDDGVVEWWECVDIFAGEVAAENGGGGGGEGGGRSAVCVRTRAKEPMLALMTF